MTQLGETLTQSLDRCATTQSKTDLEHFYQLLLRAEVFVPLRPKSGREAAESGATSLDAQGILVANSNGSFLVPFFSEAQFVDEWRGEPGESKPIAFSALMRHLPDEMLAHLNPGQECGREFSAWELSLLRKGEEAIPEIVAALLEEGDDGLDTGPIPAEWEEMKRSLRPMLEAYREIKECFLVAGVDQNGHEFPIFGLNEEKMSAERKMMVRDELVAYARGALNQETNVQVMDDLNVSHSVARGLFTRVKPFYIANADGSSRTDEESGADGSFLRGLKKFLPKWKGSSADG